MELYRRKIEFLELVKIRFGSLWGLLSKEQLKYFLVLYLSVSKNIFCDDIEQMICFEKDFWRCYYGLKLRFEL